MNTVFSVACNTTLGNQTLLAALGNDGGNNLAGAQRILIRAAVAAVLNASHPNVDYPLTAAQVISQVNAVICGGNRQAILNLATQLDNLNNLGCPLGANANAGAPQVPHVAEALIKVFNPIYHPLPAMGVLYLLSSFVNG